jgi:uncharacterized protein (DUF2252 family)
MLKAPNKLVREAPNDAKSVQIKKLPSLEARREFGRRLRTLVSRVTQANLRLSRSNNDPVSILLDVNRKRQQNLLPIKWGRMNASPFGFFRGAAPLMAADLAKLPVTGIQVQMCGDAHILNLGAYSSPDGHLVFDINDFDETLPGPWEWDVKRLATSLVLAGRESKITKGDYVEAVRAFVEAYRTALKVFSDMKVMELTKWAVRAHTQNDSVHAIFRKAQRATSDVVLKKLTEFDGKKLPKFHDRPPILYHVPAATAKAVVSSLELYRQTLGVDRRQLLDSYRPVDVTFKVVGTGSIGTLDYVILLLGNKPDDALFIQVKEELPSCYAPFLPNQYGGANQGQRVADGQHRMQTVTDSLVGWTTIEGRDFLVRQLADHKASIDVSELKGSTLLEYGLVCGEVLAKAHARTGDASAIYGYCGDSSKLDRAIAKFALAYADQTDSDYNALHKAVKTGRLKTITLR